MQNDVSIPPRHDHGFGLIEMLVVVAIVAIMAAVALPNIGSYIRNYKIRGAAQDVAGELQASRSKAIMSNANAGVSFVVVDVDSYRYVQEDLIGGPDPDDEFGPLRELPNGVRFVPTSTTNASPSVRFNRLGGYCNPGDSASGCGAGVTLVCRSPEEDSRCATGGAGSSYIQPDTTTGVPAGGLVVTLLEGSTGLQRTVRLAPGGRVLPQP